jgi:hypothetical protein
MDNQFNSSGLNQIARALTAFFVLVVFWGLYEVGLSVYQSQNTGTLEASSSGALLSIYQPSHQIQDIGTSSAKVRLKPGSYKLFASIGKRQESRTIVIYKKQTTVQKLTVTVPTAQTTPPNIIESDKLIKLLPFYGPNFEYTINYKYTFTSSIPQPIITIDTTAPTGLQDAEAWISGMGFNISLLDIQSISTSATPGQPNDAQ